MSVLLNKFSEQNLFVWVPPVKMPERASWQDKDMITFVPQYFLANQVRNQFKVRYFRAAIKSNVYVCNETKHGWGEAMLKEGLSIAERSIYLLLLRILLEGMEKPIFSGGIL